jgi:hypothetical protein
VKKIEKQVGENMFLNAKYFLKQKTTFMKFPSPPLPPKKVLCECLKQQITIHVDNFIIVNNIHD